jgi:hypothetical protein
MAGADYRFLRTFSGLRKSKYRPFAVHTHVVTALRRSSRIRPGMAGLMPGARN